MKFSKEECIKGKIIKGLFLIIVVVYFTANSCVADDYILENESKYQKNIMETGFRLLNANSIEKRITFFYNNEKIPKVKSSDRTKQIIVNKGIIPYLSDDDELAAILSTQIAQLTESHQGFFKRVTISFSPRKYEVKSDKKAVDLMVNAGYDPIALINIINKTAGEPNWFEYSHFYHRGNQRTAYIYQYIYEKYPIYLADNQYFNNLYYQNFLHNTKKERKKARIIQEERIKRYKKESIKTQ